MIVDNRILWSRLKTNTVTVSVRPVKKAKYVFAVSRLVSLNARKQMAFLSSLADDREYGLMSPTNKLKEKIKFMMPAKSTGFDFVVTDDDCGPVYDPYHLIGKTCKSTRIGPIVPDVLRPGDFLVFQESSQRGIVKFVEALRVAQG